MHNKIGIVALVNCINGDIRHSTRLVQLHRVCSCLSICPKIPCKMSKSNAWFAGFFDADGTVTLNSKRLPQLTISVTNKALIDVQYFIDVFGGNIYFDTRQNGYYK